MSRETPRGPSRGERLLPRFSLERRVTVLVLLATTLVVGAVAAVSIPLELFPRGFDPSFLGVQVPWRDAPSEEVLEKVVIPLEEEISTVRGLDTVSSLAGTGFARLNLQFKYGTDMDVAYRELRDRIERARRRLPADADRIFVLKHDESAIPVAFVGLALDPALTDAYDLVQNDVVLPLERLDGVATVRANGLEEKEILIELDRRATEAAGLNIYQLGQELQGDNFSLASGNVRSGDRKLLLRSLARYADLGELRARRLAPGVRLGDVATVRYEEPEKRYRIRVNSKPAIGVEILKEGEANTLEVTRAIRRTVEKLRQDPRLAHVEMEVLFDQGQVILESLDTLLDSGRIGGLFAFAVLFFFLRRLRMTLIVSLAIPLSILMGLVAMYFAGETLNVLSLLGLMICVGLLVDNSVVVAENIYRLHRAGVPRREACLQGSGEIALAITMATLTTVVVFLPVSLVEGRFQFFLLRLSIPVSASLVASLVVALVFVPLAVYLTLPERPATREGGRLQGLQDGFHTLLRRAYDATFGWLNRGYGRLLAFFLRRRFELLVALGLVLAGTLVVARGSLRFVAQDENERSGFEVDVEMPPSYGFEDTERYFLAAEKVLEANKERWGLDGYFFFHRTADGEIQGWLANPPTTELTPRQITEEVMAALPETPGVRLYTGRQSETRKDELAVKTFTLNGEDAGQLERVEQDLAKLFSKVDGVLGLQLGGEQAPNELALVVDRERARRQQVNPAVVAGVVGYALRGQPLPKYYAGGREIPVRVRFREEDRRSLTDLVGFEVPTADGEPVSLSSLTDVRFLDTTRLIRRIDKRLARTLTIELAEGREEETRRRLESLAARLDLPEGVSFGEPRAGRGEEEDLAALGLAAGLSILFIYLLMGFLFDSFVLPLSILGTLPLAGIGVVWVHVAAGRNIDFLGTVGLVLLIGVVVNNGIVLIDYANRLRQEGHERREALLLAASRRFRPIMMTALTTIFGLVPLTLGGKSSIGLSYTSFGYTLIGGLTTATLLTLLVVPVFYTLFDDAGEAVGTALRRRRAAA